MFELQEWQLVLIGLIATLIAQGIKLYQDRKGVKISTPVIQWVVFVLSLPFALWFGSAAFPPFPPLVGEPAEIVGAVLQYLSLWVVLAGEFIGVATVIYHALKAAVFDKIGALRVA